MKKRETEKNAWETPSLEWIHRPPPFCLDSLFIRRVSWLSTGGAGGAAASENAVYGAYRGLAASTKLGLVVAQGLVCHARMDQFIAKHADKIQGTLTNDGRI